MNKYATFLAKNVNLSVCERKNAHNMQQSRIKIQIVIKNFTTSCLPRY